MSRVLIAVPTYEGIYPDTFKSIYQLERGGHEVRFDFVRGYDVANARNKIASLAIDGDFDYVLMVDNDIVLPKNALLDLMEAEKDYPLSDAVVIGYYLSRPSGGENKSGRTTVFKFGGKDYVAANAYMACELESFAETGLEKVQVRGGGFGCALVPVEIFRKMPYPCFRWTDYGNKTQLSEDLYFCEQLKKINVPIFVGTKVRCGHMMRYVAYV